MVFRRIVSQPFGLSSTGAHQIYVGGSFGTSIEYDALSVRRPTGASGIAPLEIGQRRGIRSIAVRHPNLPRAAAVRRERDRLAVGRIRRRYFLAGGSDEFHRIGRGRAGTGYFHAIDVVIPENAAVSQ